jgi:hypothetical protein
MGAERLNPMRAGTIRRVVRQGHRFTCGLCRSAYEEEKTAEDCVHHCWQELLQLSPVITKRRGFRALVYRCRFCARDFATAHDAARCAADCKTLHSERHEKEQALVDAGVVGDRPRPRRQTPRLVALPVKTFTRRAPTMEIEEGAEAPAAPSGSPVTVDAGVAPTVAAGDVQEDAPKAKKAKPSEVFYRDGAKYACTVCNKRYFTKNEVTACYEGH